MIDLLEKFVIDTGGLTKQMIEKVDQVKLK